MENYFNIVQNTVFVSFVGLFAPFLFPYLFKIVGKWSKRELTKQEKRLLVGLVSFLVSLVVVAIGFDSTDVVTFSDLQRVALNNSFNAKGYKISKEVFEDIKVPVIARILRKMDYPHFVVVQNINQNAIMILDPNAGKFVISKREFYSYWIDKDSNFILLVLPQDQRKEFKRLDSFLVKYLF